MKKRSYRAAAFQQANLEQLERRLPSRVVVGIDIAKKVMFATLMSESEEILTVLKWDHLSESRHVVSWLSGLTPVSEVALEPSGTYGDTLKACLHSAGLEVFRVSPKMVKDAREIFDGVPSTHDAKASATLAWLHLSGRSARWEPASDFDRRLKAAIGTLSLHQSAFSRSQNNLEAQLTRYWPEVLPLLDLDSVSLLELLSRYGGPQSVKAHNVAAAQCLRRAGGPGLKEEKIQDVLKAADKSLGVSMIDAERDALQELAAEARRRQKAFRAAQQRVKNLSCEDIPTVLVGAQVGAVTAAVIRSELGSFLDYANTGGLLKGGGLNLKEVSSGRRQGELAITKRGSSRLRQYLYLAVLRWIQKDAVACAWYEKKVQRDGGKIKAKALVALMRKLLRGLWWVARGETFDSRKLFDVQRLGV
jgi:transposase